jgi:hypothetical protein
MIDLELDGLLNDLPLSPQWERPSLMRHVANIGGTLIHLAGLSTVDRGGQSVCGSAGQLVGSPLARAYYELIERTAVVEAMGQSRQEFEILNFEGEVVGKARSSEVFPQSSDEQCWRYARSNGVAVGVDWQDATHRAGLEMTERDRVLRSWYGEIVPEWLQISSNPVPRSLDHYYNFETYVFPGVVEHGDTANVVGIFGFPSQESAPLVFGLGARHRLHEALAAAACECLQRLGFLWGETIPEVLPAFAPTPDFHQEFYLHRPNQERLLAWLRGDHAKFAGVLGDRPREPGVPLFVDLTPDALRSQLVVAKALPANELPLTFGRGHPRLKCAFPEMLAIHPIA